MVWPKSPLGCSTRRRFRKSQTVAQEGEVVGAPLLPLDLGGKSQPHLRLADQVERGVGQRDVLLQHGGVAAPLADPVAEDQRVVSHPQEELEQGSPFHHMCPASSGMSKKLGWR